MASQHLRKFERVAYSLFAGTVPAAYFLFAGNVPAAYSLFAGTVPAFNLFHYYMSKVLISTHLHLVIQGWAYFFKRDNQFVLR